MVEENEHRTPPSLEGAIDRVPPGEESREIRRGRVRSVLRRFLGILMLMVLVFAGGAGGYLWWLHSLNYESTDNAYVRATVVPLSSRVSGVVSEVLVDDNQAVHEGDLLVRLDPSMYRVAVEKAEAEVAVAHARYESSKISVAYSTDRMGPLLDEAQARLARLRQTLRSARSLLMQRRNETQAAAFDLARVRDELARKRKLHEQQVISDESLDQSVATYKVAQAKYNASEAAQRVEEDKVAALRQQLKEMQASIALVKNEGLSAQMKSMDSKSIEAELKRARAKLKEARLLFSYAEIRAPVAGYVNKKSVDVGSYVEPGRPLLVIVPLHRVFIQANFKEVQLEDIRVGQPARVIADAYPDHPFRGHVDSIYSGTGDAFSLLPPENATGNWVKVTRRVPVKIVLDEAPPPHYPLLIGMSAQVRVDIRDRSGSRLLAYPSRAQKSPNEER